MPKVMKPAGEEIPDALRPYTFHGLELTRQPDKDEYLGECPFCGKFKFAVTATDGRWRCLVCGGPSKKGGGNSYNFIRELYDLSKAQTTKDDLEQVAIGRRLSVAILERWGLVKSALGGEYMLPGYGLGGGLNNLYRWGKVKGDKRALKGTATMSHCLFGVQHWDKAKPEAHICEGAWDPMALEMALSLVKSVSDGTKSLLVDTTDPNQSLRALTNIVALPGCETFKEEWIELFRGKHCIVMFDNDHPKRFPTSHKQAGEVRMVRGKPMVPGWLGTEAVCRRLKPIAASLRIMQWGDEGYDTRLPDGFDVRDCLTTDTVLGMSDEPN